MVMICALGELIKVFRTADRNENEDSKMKIAFHNSHSLLTFWMLKQWNEQITERKKTADASKSKMPLDLGLALIYYF